MLASTWGLQNGVSASDPPVGPDYCLTRVRDLALDLAYQLKDIDALTISNFPVSVKLGTIKPERRAGDGDFLSLILIGHAQNESDDSNLSGPPGNPRSHLSRRNLNVQV